MAEEIKPDNNRRGSCGPQRSRADVVQVSRVLARNNWDPGGRTIRARGRAVRNAKLTYQDYPRILGKGSGLMQLLPWPQLPSTSTVRNLRRRAEQSVNTWRLMGSNVENRQQLFANELGESFLSDGGLFAPGVRTAVPKSLPILTR